MLIDGLRVLLVLVTFEMSNVVLAVNCVLFTTALVQLMDVGVAVADIVLLPREEVALLEMAVAVVVGRLLLKANVAFIFVLSGRLPDVVMVALRPMVLDEVFKLVVVFAAMTVGIVLNRVAVALRLLVVGRLPEVVLVTFKAVTGVVMLLLSDVGKAIVALSDVVVMSVVLSGAPSCLFVALTAG